MKLNYDCVRDVLLAVEKLTHINDKFIFEIITWEQIYQYGTISQYTDLDVLYTLYQLKEAEFIIAAIPDTIDGIKELDVRDMTFKGHQYLNSIRDNSIWCEVKKRLKSFTVEAIKFTAETIATEQIGRLFG